MDRILLVDVTFGSFPVYRVRNMAAWFSKITGLGNNTLWFGFKSGGSDTSLWPITCRNWSIPELHGPCLTCRWMLQCAIAQHNHIWWRNQRLEASIIADLQHKRVSNDLSSCTACRWGRIHYFISLFYSVLFTLFHFFNQELFF